MPAAFASFCGLTLSGGACEQYTIEEIERVLVAQEGKQYVLEACVATTATYGDRMRSVVRTRCVIVMKVQAFHVDAV